MSSEERQRSADRKSRNRYKPRYDSLSSEETDSRNEGEFDQEMFLRDQLLEEAGVQAAEKAPGQAADTTLGSKEVPSTKDTTQTADIAEQQQADTGKPTNEQSKEDNAYVEALGKRLEPEDPAGGNIDDKIVVRWSEIMKKGLPIEERKTLLRTYPAPANCLEIKPPKLGPEFKGGLVESVLIRDKRLVEKQEKTVACLSALGKAASLLVSEEPFEKIELLKLVSDASRLLLDLQRDMSLTRKSLILLNVNPTARRALETTEIGELLFGKEVEGHLKTVQTVERTSNALKSSKTPIRQSKNLKGPPRQWAENHRQKAEGGLKKSFTQKNQRYKRPGHFLPLGTGRTSTASHLNNRTRKQ